MSAHFNLLFLFGNLNIWIIPFFWNFFWRLCKTTCSTTSCSKISEFLEVGFKASSETSHNTFILVFFWVKFSSCSFFLTICLKLFYFYVSLFTLSFITAVFPIYIFNMWVSIMFQKEFYHFWFHVPFNCIMQWSPSILRILMVNITFSLN